MAPPHTAAARTTDIGLVGHAVEFNWRRILTMWMFSIQYALLMCHLWPALVPEASHGILAFARRDVNLSPTVMVVVFLFCIGITWRGVRPRLWLLGMLTGQGLLAGITLVYALRGVVTLAQVAGHGGLFMLCVFAVMALVQKDAARPWMVWRWRFDAQAFLIPTIGVTLMLYALGLATRPDAGIAMFIQGQFGTPLIAILVAAFALGAGVVIQNHISASRLFVALVPQGIYAVMAIGLLGADNDVSLAGVIVHLLFTVTAMCVVLIQTKEYAHALVRQRQRGTP